MFFKLARKGNVEELKSYLKANPNTLNSVNENGSTPLILACYYNNIDVVRELVYQGADIDSKIDMGTALMAAVVKGNDDIVLFLLEKGANPNLKDSNQSTALIYATLFKNKEIMSMLIKYKADKNLKDARNLTALDYAKQFNNEELIQILK
ncbi:MAG: ankyrin repeat domain-containing protein [Flavobacterium sp.]|nr:ankyrin repeat domain-containing protein [Flavobacterium sp.]